jgi:hypothetical protein
MSQPGVKAAVRNRPGDHGSFAGLALVLALVGLAAALARAVTEPA